MMHLEFEIHHVLKSLIDWWRIVELKGYRIEFLDIAFESWVECNKYFVSCWILVLYLEWMIF